MDIQEIRQLAELMRDTDIGRLEVDDGTVRVVLEAKSAPAHTAASAAAPIAAAAAAVVSPAAPPARDPALRVLTSPLVGTVYMAPEAGGKPYVQVGDWVNKGDTLCLLESMKMFNEFRSDYSGRLVEICVENAQVVDFGQDLFVLRVEDNTDAS